MKRFRRLDTSIFVDSGARSVSPVSLTALVTTQSLEYSVHILLCALMSVLCCGDISNESHRLCEYIQLPCQLSG
jgi:hypothetical protein